MTYLSIYLSVYLSPIYLSIKQPLDIHTCIYTYIYTHTYRYIYMHIHADTYRCIHTYTYIRTYGTYIRHHSFTVCLRFFPLGSLKTPLWYPLVHPCQYELGIYGLGFLRNTFLQECFPHYRNAKKYIYDQEVWHLLFLSTHFFLHIHGQLPSTWILHVSIKLRMVSCMFLLPSIYHPCCWT